MNVADSQRVASALERLGYHPSPQAEDADVIVLNTCVVRQSAEDKAYGRLTSLRPLKQRRPELVINLMGCLVGVREPAKLRQRLPYVDVFSPPSDVGPLVEFLTRAKPAAWRKTPPRSATPCWMAIWFYLRASAANWSRRMCRWSWAAHMPAPSASSLTAAASSAPAAWAISWQRYAPWRRKASKKSPF